MNWQTADQALIQIIFQRNLVQDPSERAKLDDLILGVVESKERKKARISAQLDKYPRYQFKSKKK